MNVIFVVFQIHPQSAILISGNRACKSQYNQDQSYKTEEKEIRLHYNSNY